MQNPFCSECRILTTGLAGSSLLSIFWSPLCFFSLLKFYFERIPNVQIHWYNTTEFPVLRANIFGNQIPISKAKKWGLANANALNKAVVAGVGSWVRKPWGLCGSHPPCPVSPRCVSGQAFFYTGSRCQAIQVHGSPGPADRRRGQRDLLDLHHYLHPLPNVKAVMPKDASQKQKCPCPWALPLLPLAQCSLGLFSSASSCLQPPVWPFCFLYPCPHMVLLPCPCSQCTQGVLWQHSYHLIVNYFFNRLSFSKTVSSMWADPPYHVSPMPGACLAQHGDHLTKANEWTNIWMNN